MVSSKILQKLPYLKLLCDEHQIASGLLSRSVASCMRLPSGSTNAPYHVASPHSHPTSSCQANTESSGLPKLPSQERREWAESNYGREEPSPRSTRFGVPTAEEGEWMISSLLYKSVSAPWPKTRQEESTNVITARGTVSLRPTPRLRTAMLPLLRSVGSPLLICW
ncbi:Aldo-keto reductase yakc [Fusarium oxysporum f. sp. albedinis]|nr:Aldo-keto reductase yakc [Fusarium oxysporum f. sp. albedinis]